MYDVNLVEQIVKTLEKELKLEAMQATIFKDRYDLIMDCTVDEMNDDIARLKLDKFDQVGSFTLVKGGEYVVYRNGVLSTAHLLGGESFVISRVQRNDHNKASALDLVMAVADLSSYTHLVIPFEKIGVCFTNALSKVIGTNLGEALKEAKKATFALRVEMETAEQERNLRLFGTDENSAYADIATW